MRCYLLFGLLGFTKGDRIIKNIDVPACRNCIYYRPDPRHSEFTSALNRCEKLGEKNIVTNEIKYNYADTARERESLCGPSGKYFVEEKNVNLKILKHSILSKKLQIGFISFLIFYLCASYGIYSKSL